MLHDPLGYGVAVNKPTAARLQAFAALIDELRDYSRSEQDLYAVVERVIRQTGILADLQSDSSGEGKARLENIKELLGGIDEYVRTSLEADLQPTLGSYLSEVALMTDQDTAGEGDDAVTLMTIHASKGLEFAHVFILGLEEDLFPSMMSNVGRELEEERRLFYVALTRAERSCHLGYARERFRNGRTEYCRPSRFLRELPQELLRMDTPLSTSSSTGYGSARRGYSEELPMDFSAAPIFEARPARPSRKVFVGRREAGEEAPQPVSRIGKLRIGSRVLHKRFGEGEVMELEGAGDDAKATVAFDAGDTKKLLLRFAQLELLD